MLMAGVSENMQPEFPQALPRRNASAEFPRPSEARDENRFSDQNLRSFCLCCAIVIDLPKKKNRCSYGDSLLSFSHHLAEFEVIVCPQVGNAKVEHPVAVYATPGVGDRIQQSKSKYSSQSCAKHHRWPVALLV